MNANSKLCPLCGSDPVTSYLGVYCSGRKNIMCFLRRDPIEQSQWNSRPQEQILKDAIDILMKGISSATDENITHKFRNSRLKQAVADARKKLGI